LNEIDLPLPLPFLQAFFAMDGGVDVFKCLEIDEVFDAMFFREPVDKPFPMLPDALEKIIRHADVKRSIALAGNDIGVIDVRHRRGFNWMARCCGP